MMKASDGDPRTHNVDKIAYSDFMKLVPPLCPSHIFEEGSAIYTSGGLDRNFFLINQGQVALMLSEKAVSAAEGEQGMQIEEGTRLVEVETLGRGETFGAGELLASSGALRSGSTPLTRSNVEEDSEAGMENSEKNAAAVVSVLPGGGRGGGKESEPVRGGRRGGGGGREWARGGGGGLQEDVGDVQGAGRKGVPRVTQAVCTSKRCEVMAMPRHMFATLADEFPGIQERLRRQ
ncbi:unnamed protein product, partial [Choristocarpus tenellus]